MNANDLAWRTVDQRERDATYWLRIFVLSHDSELLNAVSERPAFRKVHLPTLELGNFQTNLLGEGRAFLARLDAPNAAFIGFANARWNQKYAQLQTSLDDLPELARKRMASDRVLAPWPTDAEWFHDDADWLRLTLREHPSMAPLLTELSEVTGLELNGRRRSLWGNDFICSNEVWHRWREFWLFSFGYFYGKYGVALPFSPDNLDASRYCAYFFERVTTLFFSHQRDLTIEPIP